MAKAKYNRDSKSVAPKSGQPDFKKEKLGGNKTVKCDYPEVPSSGTPDWNEGKKSSDNGFDMGGNKVVKSGGGDMTRFTECYETIKKARTEDSDF